VLQLGSLKIWPPTVLAPMAGITTPPFRQLCRRMHCGLVATELTNAEGLARRQAKTMHFLEAWPDERPLAAHIYGHDPDVMARAAVVAEELGRFDLIDVNAGCPVPKIMRRGEGAGLMKTPEKLKQMVQAICAAVKLPVTVKTRIGFHYEHLLIDEVAQAVEEGGAAGLFLHGRTVDRRHAGFADWQTIARIKRERKMPVIGNGGILSADDALRRMTETGVDGVMIGRAAIGTPWLFGEIAARFEGRPWTPPAPAEKVALLVEMLEGQIRLTEMEHKFRRRIRYEPESSSVMQFRTHLAHLLRGRVHQRDLMRQCMSVKTAADVHAALAAILT
jgi:tRNA-dihydrouridine synthase B